MLLREKLPPKWYSTYCTLHTNVSPLSAPALTAHVRAAQCMYIQYVLWLIGKGTMAKRHKGTRAAFQTVDICKSAITSLLDAPAGSVFDLAFLGELGDRERRGGFFMPESLYVRERTRCTLCGRNSRRTMLTKKYSTKF